MNYFAVCSMIQIEAILRAAALKEILYMNSNDQSRRIQQPHPPLPPAPYSPSPNWRGGQGVRLRKNEEFGLLIYSYEINCPRRRK